MPRLLLPSLPSHVTGWRLPARRQGPSLSCPACQPALTAACPPALLTSPPGCLPVPAHHPPQASGGSWPRRASTGSSPSRSSTTPPTLTSARWGAGQLLWVKLPWVEEKKRAGQGRRLAARPLRARRFPEPRSRATASPHPTVCRARHTPPCPSPASVPPSSPRLPCPRLRTHWQGPIYSEWFKGGKTNIAYNCLDRHVAEGHGAQPCFLFEGNDVGRDAVMTYKQVLDEVCRVVSGSIEEDQEEVVVVAVVRNGVYGGGLLLRKRGSGGWPCAARQGGFPPSRGSATPDALCPALLPAQANWLRSVGVKKGDAVAIYMPMVCEVGGTSSCGRRPAVAAPSRPALLRFFILCSPTKHMGAWRPAWQAMLGAVPALRDRAALPAAPPPCAAPQLPIAMLACARIGAVHSVVFGGFSSDALASRIEDCKARVLITCNAVMRGAKAIGLKKIADQGCDIAHHQGFDVSTARPPTCQPSPPPAPLLPLLLAAGCLRGFAAHAVAPQLPAVRSLPFSCPSLPAPCLPQVEHVLVYANDNAAKKEDTHMVAGRDVFWQDVIPQQPDTAGAPPPPPCPHLPQLPAAARPRPASASLHCSRAGLCSPFPMSTIHHPLPLLLPRCRGGVDGQRPSSTSTRLAAPASPRACCTPPAASWCAPHTGSSLAPAAPAVALLSVVMALHPTCRLCCHAPTRHSTHLKHLHTHTHTHTCARPTLSRSTRLQQ